MAYGQGRWQCAALPKEEMAVLPDSTQNLKRHKNINRKLVDAATKGGVVPLLNVVMQELPCMNGVNLATALHRIARHCVDGETDPNAVASRAMLQEIEAHPAFNLLLRAVEMRAEAALSEPTSFSGEEESLPAQCTSIVAWSLASLNICNYQLLAVLAELATPRLDEFKFYEVTNMLWAYAKLGAAGHCPQLFSSIAQRLRRRGLGEFKAHCLCLAAWSFAKAKWRDVQLIEGIVNEISGQVDLLKPESVSNICWALAKLKMVPHPLFETVAWSAVSSRCLQRIRPHELSTILRAFATAGMPPVPGFFAKTGAIATRLADAMAPNQVVTVLMAYVRAGSKECPDLGPQLLSVAANRISEYTPQEMIAALQLALDLCPGHGPFFQACATSSVSRVTEFNNQDLSCLVDAFHHADQHNAIRAWTLSALVQEQRKRASGSPLASTDASSAPSSDGESPSPLEGEALSRHAPSKSFGGVDKHRLGGQLAAVGPPRPQPGMTLCPEKSPWKVRDAFEGLRPPPGLESPSLSALLEAVVALPEPDCKALLSLPSKVPSQRL